MGNGVLKFNPWLSLDFRLEHYRIRVFRELKFEYQGKFQNGSISGELQLRISPQLFK
jgi:hypothetical protein